MKSVFVIALMVFSTASFAKGGKVKPKAELPGVLNVWSTWDYETRQYVDDYKFFEFDLKAVEKMNPQFYIFIKGNEDIQNICFKGKASEAADIIDAILNVSTGDAYVYPEKAVITKDKITQDVRYEDESGDNNFTLEVDRC